MRIEFLGTAGAIRIPRPGCDCRICAEARQKGVPYARSGPSLFIHGPDVLIDTPEESAYELARAGIGHVRAGFYSHWHPDHVMGRRVWEMNVDWEHWPPQNRTTDLYLPQQVAHDFRRALASWDHLSYLEQKGLVRLHELTDGDAVEIEGVAFRPFRLAEDYVYAFLLESDGQRVLIAMDELFGWEPPEAVRGVDLAVLPMGIMEFHPLTGERITPAGHPILQMEATYAQTLTCIRALDASAVYLAHIEEPDRMSYDELRLVEQGLQEEGLNVRFAYDTLCVEV
jgi:phosphoribosyl 1,2-cyclic phosphate phosphodiesterase